MPFSSLFDKELKLLKKSRKMHEKAEKLVERRDPDGKEILNTLIELVESNVNIIKTRKEDFSNLLVLSGVALRKCGDLDSAERSFLLSLKLNEENVDAYTHYAFLLALKKKYDEALKTIERGINIDRKNKSAWEMKAEIYELMGDIDEALSIYKKLINLYPEEIKYFDKYLEYRPKDVDVLFKKGVQLYRIKSYDGCVKTMKTVVEIDRDHQRAWVYLGAAYTKMERIEDAIKAFKEALKTDPNDKPSWVNLGIIYKKRGEYLEALKSFEEAIKIEPNDKRSWYLKASVLYSLGRYGEGLSAVNKALELDEKYEEALFLKRDILKHINRPEEMVRVARQLLELGHEDIDILLDLAKAYYTLKDYENAWKITLRILQKTPHHIPTLQLQKEIMKKQKKWDKVIAICENILNIEPSNIEAIMDEAHAYRAMGKLESSLNLLIKASEIERKSIEIWRERKDVAKELNKPQEVIIAATEILSMEEDYESYKDLARAYYTISRYDEAKKIMEKGLRIKEDAEGWNLLGMIYYKLRDFENARRAFEKAAEMNPEVKKYWNNLGWTAEKLENYEKAIEYFDKALKLEPEDMRIWYQRALCLKKLGRKEEALVSFQEALKINPTFTKALFEKSDILISLGNLNEALSTLDILLDKEPANHRALYRRAWIRLQKKEFEAALKDIENALKYEKKEEYLELKKEICKSLRDTQCVINISREILSINKKNVGAWRDLAQSYLEIGKIDSAIAKYKEALEILPENKVLLYELKNVLLSNNRFADVIDVAKKILAIEPSDFRNIIDLSRALMNLKKFEEAREYLSRALKLNRNREVLELIGDVYFELGKYENALENYKDAARLEASEELYYKLALTSYRMERVGEALKYLNNVLKTSKKAEYYLLASELYLKKGSLDSALKYAQQAYQIKDSTETRMRLANILFELKKYEDVVSLLKPPVKEGDFNATMLMGKALEGDKRYKDAIALYQKVIDKDKRNLEAWLGIARCYLYLENYEKAAEAYERAYLLNPEDKEICRSLAFIYDKLGKLQEALTYIDRGISLDPKDKYFWNSKALALMKMKKYEEAIQAFEHALQIDPEFSAALEGKKDCERIIEEREIEKYARSVLIHEYKSGKKVTKKVAFQKLDIPLSYLNKVFAYLRKDVSLNIDKLNNDERENFEKASLKLAKKLNKIENVSLAEIVANTELDVLSAKTLLKYIESCLAAKIKREPDENIERLLKKALMLELKDHSLLNLMINLDVGICTARLLQEYLKELEEEEEEEREVEVKAEEKEPAKMEEEEKETDEDIFL